MRPPADVNVGNIVDAFPVLLLNEVSHPRAIAARRASKHAVHGLSSGCLAVLPRRLQCGRVFLHMLSDIVLLEGFRQCRYHLHGFLQPFHSDVQRIAEKAADPGSNVDARALQLRKGQHFQPDNPAAAPLPYGTYSQEIEELGDALPVGSHVGIAPQHDAHALGIMPLLGNEARHRLLR